MQNREQALGQFSWVAVRGRHPEFPVQTHWGCLVVYPACSSRRPPLPFLIPWTLRPSLLGSNVLYPCTPQKIPTTWNSLSCGIFIHCRVLPGMWLWLTRLLIHCNHIFIISPWAGWLVQVNSCLLLKVFTDCHLPRREPVDLVPTAVTKNCFCIFPHLPFLVLGC